MKKHSKVGNKKGKPAYRTPSSFIARASRLKGKVHKMRIKKKK